jgi:hypothetical protein
MNSQYKRDSCQHANMAAPPAPTRAPLAPPPPPIRSSEPLLKSPAMSAPDIALVEAITSNQDTERLIALSVAAVTAPPLRDG